jgi:hypothetical protein
MFHRYLLLVTLLSVSVPAYADLVTFNSLAAFTTAAPELRVETFESALLGTSDAVLCNPGPLSSSVGGGCFPAGGLLPGVVYSSSPDPRMSVLGPNPMFPLLLNTSKVLGTSIPGSSILTVTFTDAAVAVGFEVFPGLVDGPVVVSVFSPSDAALGTFTIPAIRGGSFFGVLSTTDAIGRLNIDGPNNPQSGGEFIDNLRFATVPEPSSMLLLAAGLALVFRLKRA